jgi:8-hydroxy-5-deazaflavin:NADPH oxidoreductase
VPGRRRPLEPARVRRPTDDDAAEATAQRLVRAAGFEPVKVGGVSEAGRIEGPDGELQGRIFDLDEARASVATEGAKA